MLRPVPWEAVPADFRPLTWQGDGDRVADAPAVVHPVTHASIFVLELTEQDRRQLIEGNPVYLLMVGHVVPFAVGVNLAEVLELARDGS